MGYWKFWMTILRSAQRDCFDLSSFTISLNKLCYTTALYKQFPDIFFGCTCDIPSFRQSAYKGVRLKGRCKYMRPSRFKQQTCIFRTVSQVFLKTSLENCKHPKNTIDVKYIEVQLIPVLKMKVIFTVSINCRIEILSGKDFFFKILF